MKSVPPKRRIKIAKRAKRAVERIAVSQLRKLAGFSQSELAARMGARQPTLSPIESQTDMKISTLAGIVASLGGKMRIIVQLPQGEFVISHPRRAG
jgi:transcriptional regulator with XRE-family HTH domain